jgi:subtilisin family serine protease
MKRFAPLACALALVASHGGAAALGATTAAPPMRPVIVRLDAQASLGGLPQPRAQRLRELVTRLKDTARTTQLPVLQLLATRQRQGLVGRVRPMWVMNAVAVTAAQSVIDELRAMPPVAGVTPDGTGIVPAASPPQWNISLANAPPAWDAGDTGQGVVVASLDTGVDVTHPDLASRWRGGSDSWYDPYGQHTAGPVDFSGHGTQTMGVMVGGDAGGSSIGVAPGAKWIAARVFDDQGSATVSAVHFAFQWVLDPDHDSATADSPQVVNNSWTMTSGCSLEFLPDIDALRAAGIAPVFAAGNGGPGADTGFSPANNPGALAVGSTSSLDVIANDSSRGPTSCGGTGRTFPSLVAPGVGIRTADLFSGYTTQSGTSLAAPHVAGALALLLSAHPGLSATAQETALTSTAVDLGAAGVDDSYGAGRIDIAAALRSLGSDTAGPVVSGLEVSGDGSLVTGSAADALSNVAAAEWFEGADPGVGLGSAMSAVDGVFDSTSEQVGASLSLASGQHTLWVRARDAAGNWGAAVSVTFTVDTAGPVVGGLVVSGDGSLVTGTAADALSNVAAAEWFEGADPGVGLGSAMSAVDGVFDSTSEQVGASLSLASGQHTLWVRARDAAGNWGAAASVTFTVPPPRDVIFQDGFASGTLAAWSKANRLTAANLTGQAALHGSDPYGLRVAVAGTMNHFLIDSSPAAEPSYHARFYFDPNATVTGSASWTLFLARSAAGSQVFSLQLSAANGAAPRLRLSMRSNGAIVTTSWVNVTDAPHAIEIAWSATTRAASLSVDGVEVVGRSGLRNATQRIEEVRLGPTSGLVRASAGVLYFDDFVSTRTATVGP